MFDSKSIYNLLNKFNQFPNHFYFCEAYTYFFFKPYYNVLWHFLISINPGHFTGNTRALVPSFPYLNYASRFFLVCLVFFCFSFCQDSANLVIRCHIRTVLTIGSWCNLYSYVLCLNYYLVYICLLFVQFWIFQLPIAKIQFPLLVVLFLL